MDNLIVLDQTTLDRDSNSPGGLDLTNITITQYIDRGYLVLDKPVGPTSHDIVATVKKILNIEKAGHSGTLDPNVSGVLLIALSNCTKLLSIYSHSRKEYICNFSSTTTIADDLLKNTLKEFSSKIYQVPPLESNVSKKLRTREIHDIELLDSQNKDVLLRIECDAGTYIRTLCIDIGRAIGCESFIQKMIHVASTNYSTPTMII